MCADVVPNFFIVGAAKAGTTSLYSWLLQHPQVFMPEKELCHFVPEKLEGVLNWNGYLDLFAGGFGKTAVGETSVGYLWNTKSAGLIYDNVRDAKIIILLRDPTKRAFSLYSYLLMLGQEDAASFEQALALEEARYYDRTFSTQHAERMVSYMYYRSGLYCDQIIRYIDLFGRDRVSIQLFEDLCNKPDQVYAATCQFLGIDPAFNPRLTRENASTIPLSISVQRELVRYQAWLRAKSFRGNYRLRMFAEYAKRVNVKLGRRPQMSAATESDLRKKFAPEVSRLSTILGRDLSGWLPK
jgi:hypothetical protein